MVQLNLNCLDNSMYVLSLVVLLHHKCDLSRKDQQCRDISLTFQLVPKATV